MRILRDDLCRSICQTADAKCLEKEYSLKIGKVKIPVRLEFKPFMHVPGQEGKECLAIEVHFIFPESQKSLMKLQYIFDSYRRCSARIKVHVIDPRTGAVIAEERSSSKDINLRRSLCYLQIDDVASHHDILYSTAKYVVFDATLEVVCSEKITTREGKDGMVIVEF